MSLRDSAEIQVRIREILTRELERRVEASVERLPVRCRHNHRQPLDSRKQVHGEKNPNHNRVSREVLEEDRIGTGARYLEAVLWDHDRPAFKTVHLPVFDSTGLCMIGAEDPTQWNGTICEDPIDAERCNVFEPLLTKENLSDEFHRQIQDHEWVQENLPEVFGLLWVLGTEQDSVPPPVPPPEPEPVLVVPLTRWRKFWRLF